VRLLTLADGLTGLKKMKRGFSFVELMIVVAVLGILAAVILPTFQEHITTAKQATAKDNLRVLRSAIELYAAQHRDVAPGYADGDTSTQPNQWVFQWQLTKVTNTQGQVAEPGTAGYDHGPYLQCIPENPFNQMRTPKMVLNTEPLPEEATGTFGWIYKAATKTIKLDWPGTDKQGIRYYDY